MTVTVYYTVTYGRGDGSDTMESEVELTPEEEAAYRRAVLLHIPLDEVPELENALSRAYDEIAEAEQDLSCELGDEYAQECEDEDCSAFDEGWSLNVYFPEMDDEDVTEADAREALIYLFENANGDYTDVDEYLERLGEEYLDFDEHLLAARVAREMGCDDYAGEKETYTFNVSVSVGRGSGDTTVDYPVTAEELELINEAIDNDECFEEAEALSDLYQRVMEAVPKQLEEDLDEINDADLDPEELSFTVDF